MKPVHLRLTDILCLPIALPLKSIGWTLSYLQDQMDEEHRPQKGPWTALLELEVLKDIGKVSEDEYQRQRQQLLAQGRDTVAQDSEGGE